MSRNSSGTYSLPAGNPVSTGTTISSTTHNNTMADIATEITSSLDRAGRGAMTAPLQLANGSSSAPALTFGSDTDSGLYRAGSNDYRMQVDAAESQRWTSAGTSVPGTLAVTGVATHSAPLRAADGAVGAPSYSFTNDTGSGLYAAGAGATVRMAATSTIAQTWTSTGVTVPVGLTVTQTSSNTAGVTSTGNGTGHGIQATGGATGAGVRGIGGATSGLGGEFTASAGNSHGLSSTGNGSGSGATLIGGATGAGVVATGGATSGRGGTFTASAGNSDGLLGTGNGTGTGINGVGGASSGQGVAGTGGAPNGAGVVGIGTGSGVGGAFTGGASGRGVSATGGGTAAGAYISAGTSSSGGTQYDAAVLSNGNLLLGGANPNSDVAFTDTLAPTNLVKAWGSISTAAGAHSVAAGFNVTSVAVTGGTNILVTLASEMANTNYAVFVTVQQSGPDWIPAITSKTTTTFVISLHDISAAANVDCDAVTGTAWVSFMVLGAQ